jgi:YidC/Oxa1 family membrane protein insertase
MIGLYQSISMVMGAQPEQLMEFSRHIYSNFPQLIAAMPVDKFFLGLNLGATPDGIGYVVPFLVLASTWIQQKMIVMPSTDPQAAQMNQSMQVMMPLFIGYISLSFPIGLSLYWIVFNVLGIAQQYMQNGWGTLFVGTPLESMMSAKGQKK